MAVDCEPATFDHSFVTETETRTESKMTIGSPRIKPGDDWSRARKAAMHFSRSTVVENVMAGLITIGVCFMVFEANLHASCRNAGTPDDSQCKVPWPVTAVNITLLMIFTVEILIHLFAYRWEFFSRAWNYVDTVIVLVGLVDWALSFEENAGIPNFTILRLFRLFKLLRTLRLLAFFPELHELLRGFAGALMAMIWGAVLIFFMLGFWSMLAVEIVPTPDELGDMVEGGWCRDAFSNIPMAMLFFFQTLVAGDSWGECTIPIMRKTPQTIGVFLGTLICVQLGVTNLILAVIVDAAAGAREKDQESKLRKKKQQERESLDRWKNLVKEIDTDGSGTISLEELLDAWETHAEVRHVFQLLDVDQQDLKDFFLLLDRDNSGDLSYSEFFHDLQKAHTQDIRMYLMHLKLEISRITHQLSEHFGCSTRCSERAVLPPVPSSVVPPAKQSWTAPAEEEAPSPTERRSTSFRISDSNPFIARLQAQLDQLTQDASSQTAVLVQNTAALVHNTRMLEALLASCNVEAPSKSPLLAPSSGRQRSGSLESARQFGSVEAGAANTTGRKPSVGSAGQSRGLSRVCSTEQLAEGAPSRRPSAGSGGQSRGLARLSPREPLAEGRQPSDPQQSAGQSLGPIRPAARPPLAGGLSQGLAGLLPAAELAEGQLSWWGSSVASPSAPGHTPGQIIGSL